MQTGKFGYKDITYDEACTIEKHSNVKEISVMRDLGSFNASTGKREYFQLAHIIGYDQNAMKNLAENNLVEGRLPQNTEEVLIEYGNTMEEIGDVITQTLENGETKEYTVVGIIEPNNNISNTDELIALINREALKPEDKVDITLLSYDVKQIYSDYYDIYYQLDSYITSTGSILDQKVQYNKTLLEYEGAMDYTSDFQKDIYTLEGVFVGIVVICSAIFIYSIINISIVERKKYFGILKSIGATTKQMRRSVRVELLIILLIALPLGILIAIGLDFALVTILNNALPELATSYSAVLSIFEENQQIIFAIPLSSIVTAIIIVVATVYLSSMIPIRKTTWSQAITLIKQNKEKVRIKKKAKVKELKNVEFRLASKNIERYKTRYLAVIMSLIISIVLIIVSSYYVENIVTKEYRAEYNYGIVVQYERSKYGNLMEKIIDDIQESNIAEKVIEKERISYTLLVNKENISNTEKEFSQKLYGDCGLMAHFDLIFASHEFDYNNVLDIYYLPITFLTLNEDAYNAYLNEIGVDKLEKNECIFVDYVNEKTKYYDGIRLTNYNEGNMLTLKYSGTGRVSTLEELQEDNLKLKIEKITNKIPENLDYLETGPIIVGTEETIISLYKQKYGENFELDDLEYRNINLKVTDIEKTNKFIETIKEKYNLNNLDESDFLNEKNNNSIKGSGKEPQELIDKTMILRNTFIYSFIGIITLVGILNMYNAINTNLEIRKREVVSLITIGMEEKQINKMLFIENAICGLLAIILGIAIGIAISYIIYYINIDFTWYAFEIPWLSIVFSIIGIVLVILISTIYLKKKIFTNNLIEVLKEEEI